MPNRRCLETIVAGRSTPQKHVWRARISDDALRERVDLDPGEICPDGGGALRLLGEAVAEMETRKNLLAGRPRSVSDPVVGFAWAGSGNPGRFGRF